MDNRTLIDLLQKDLECAAEHTRRLESGEANVPEYEWRALAGDIAEARNRLALLDERNGAGGRDAFAS